MEERTNVLHTLATDYLRQRGISEETIQAHGIEIDARISHETAKARLGQRLPDGVVEVLWIPLYDGSGNQTGWIARLLPTIGKKRFLCPLGSDGIPYIPKGVHSSSRGPLILTEGPIKALACLQAGVPAIGLNGVWCAACKKAQNEPLALRPELAALCKFGCRAYLGFDADQHSNPEVRQALIRLALLLINAGTEVLQLTSWPLEEGKGLDDYLVKHSPASESLAVLIGAAKPFLQTLSASVLDAQLVQVELPRIDFRPIVREVLIKQLAHAIGVRAEVLRDACSGPAQGKPEPPFQAIYEPLPEIVNAEELFGEVMQRIRIEAIITEAQGFVAALEVFLTWVHHQMDFSPILYITGPTLECGKTRLLNAIGKMARRPLKTSSITPASLFRLSDLFQPTFLVDEAQDAFKNEDFCTIIKAGHDPTDVAVRVDTNTWEVKTFDAFCPKVVAGIGRANRQIMSRSITIEMERDAQEVDPSKKATDPLFIEIRRKLARWANEAGDLGRFHLSREAAKMRGRDNWEVYYRVACGISANVAEKLLGFIPSFVNEEQDFDTYLFRSLRDICRNQFGDLNHIEKGAHLGSDMILNDLNKDKEAPWFGEYRGKQQDGLTREKLSARLRRYKLKPEQCWHPDINKVRGYYYIHPDDSRNSLKRVFDDYLPAEEKREKQEEKQ
jgi:hypothetical protein